MYANAQRSKLGDLLSKINKEVERTETEATLYKRQVEEYEIKFQQQLNEVKTIQQQVFEIEKAHMKMKKKYEDDIMQLRRQIDLLEGKANSQPVNGSLHNSTENSKKRPLPVQQQQVGNPNKRVRTNSDLRQSPSQSQNQQQPPQPRAQQPPTPIENQEENSRSIEVSEVTNSTNHTNTPNQTVASTPPNNNTVNTNNNSNNNGNNNTNNNNNNNGNNNNNNNNTANTPPENNNNNSNNESNDWVICYNPSVKKKLQVDLLHTLDHDSVVCCVSFNKEGNYLATGCNRSAQIFDTKTGKRAYYFSEQDSSAIGDLYIRSVCFSPDGKFLATGAEDNTVKIWDVYSQKIRNVLEGHDLDIYSLAFSRDGRHVISGSGDKKVKIWNIETGKCLYTLGDDEVGPKDGVTSISIEPDEGNLVAAGSLDKVVRIWDTRTGYFLDRYEGHSDSVYSVSFSPDGKSLASGSLDTTVKVWEYGGRARARCRQTLRGHKDFVLSVSYSPDGNWLVSGSKDRSLQFWNPRDGLAHIMLHGHTNSVISVALTEGMGTTPGSGCYATGSGDFRARIWSYTSNGT